MTGTFTGCESYGPNEEGFMRDAVESMNAGLSRIAVNER